ncbi:MAG: hypothetical protein KDH88_10515 [Chromatiales bacterium]|nr:hypothetical protein [Chromatiales bacterium]
MLNVKNRIVAIVGTATLCLLIHSVEPAQAYEDCTANLFLDRYKRVLPIPLPTLCASDAFSASDAYAFQEKFGASINDTLAGYKLALTGPLLFGATEPIYGRLYSAMLRGDNVKIQLADFVKPMLELEIAYTFAADVPPAVTLADLPGYIATLAPAAELPDLFFDNPAKLGWKDIIALNAGARQVVIGKAIEPGSIDVNGLTLSAHHEGKLVTQGNTGKNIWGNQWQALLFLVEKLNERGYQIRKGNVAISGTVSPMVPVERGHYTFDYGPLGTLQFQVE